jgi:hypothetical protein
MLKRTLKPYGITIAEFSINHYFCSAFLEKNGKYVYLTYSIPRGGMSIDFSESDALNGVLYRTASSLRDYTGGPNRFSSIEDLPTAIIDLFDWMERMGVS